MFSKTMLLAQVKTTAARITFLLGCIAVLALQGPGVARGQGQGVAHGQGSDVRTELLNALELQSGVAQSLGRANLAATLDKAMEQVLFASDADLAPLVGAIDEIQNYSGALQRLDAAIQEAAAAGEAQSVGTLSSPILRPPEIDGVVLELTPPDYFNGSFGNADGILCNAALPGAVLAKNGERNDTAVVILASAAVGTAKAVVAGLEVVCGLDIVAAATVGFGAAACTTAFVAVAAAVEILAAFQSCDATVDEAHLDAAFFRAEDNFILGSHIHEDLEQHAGDLDDLKGVTDAIAAALEQHDLDLKDLFAAHEADLAEKFAALMAAQLETIRLLTTPTGRRSTDILACDGGPCDFPNKKTR